MDLGEATSALEAQHAQFAGFFAEYGNPAPFSVTPENVRTNRDLVDSLPEHLERILADFRGAATAEAYGDDDPGMLNPYLIADGSPLAKFANSQEPVSAKLVALEQEFRTELAQCEQLLDTMLAAHRHDMASIVNAQNVAKEGNYQAAGKIIEDTHRYFKGTNYYQAEQKIASMGKQINMARQTVEGLPGEFTAGIAEVDATRVPTQQTKLLRELRTKAVNSTTLLDSARDMLEKAQEDSQYAGEMAEIEAQFTQWQHATVQELDKRIKASTSTTKRIVLISCAAAAILIIATTVTILAMTGYRVVGPNGEEHNHTFVMPGTHEVTFTLPHHKTYVAKIPVSLAGFTDLGQISAEKMGRTAGGLDIDSSPSPANFVLEGQEINDGVRHEGVTPTQITGLPTGPYTLKLSLGDFNQEVPVTVENGKVLPIKPSLSSGVVKLTSDPEGAIVSRDGKEIGTTPLEILGWSPGDHTVEMASLGVRQKHTISVTAGETTTNHFAFPRGSLLLTSEPPGAEITFANSPLAAGKAPYSADNILAGTYQAQLKFPGLEPVKRDVAVKAGKPTTVQLVIPHGKAKIVSEPPAGIIVSFPGSAIEQARTPIDLPVLPPGNYKAVARSETGPKLEKEFTVKEGETTDVLFTFPRGKLEISATPAGAKYAIKGVSGVRGEAPSTLDSVLAGIHTVDFFLNGVNLRRKVNVPENGEAKVRAQFLEAYLKANKSKIKKSTRDSFNQDGRLVEGVGTKHAKLGGPVAGPIRQFGLPDKVKRLPDAELGSKYIITWENVGFSLSTDGDRILSLTYTATETVNLNTVYTNPYWTQTSKGITIGSTAEQVNEKYGAPQSTPHGKGVVYDGITFSIAPRGDVYLVTSMRVDAPTDAKKKKP